MGVENDGVIGFGKGVAKGADIGVDDVVGGCGYGGAGDEDGGGVVIGIDIAFCAGMAGGAGTVLLEVEDDVKAWLLERDPADVPEDPFGVKASAPETAAPEFFNVE
jgi:hypothetical protein